MMVRQCDNTDFDALYSIINDAAEAYRGVIPRDCWKEPYMSREYLRREMDDGVLFWGVEDSGQLVGVMGIQDVQDVIMSAIGGVNITETVEGLERYPVNLRYGRAFRDDLESLSNVLVPTPRGAHIPLQQVASLRLLQGPPAIRARTVV